MNLTDEQIQATLRRHRYTPDTRILGISYGTITTVNVYGAQLIVPTDILRGTEHEDMGTLAHGELVPTFDEHLEHPPIFPRPDH